MLVLNSLFLWNSCLSEKKDREISPSGFLPASEPATVIESIENLPPWLSVQREGPRLMTVRPDAPGLGELARDRQVGFNLMYVGGKRELVSWTPLTLRFSWDAPSFWGLLEMDQ